MDDNIEFEENKGFTPDPNTVIVTGMSMAFALPEDENDEPMVFVTFEGVVPAGDEQVVDVTLPMAFFEGDFDRFLENCQKIAEAKTVQIAETIAKLSAELD